MSASEGFAIKQNFIKRYLDCLNRLGEAGLELNAVDPAWDYVTFRRIDRRVEYHFLDDRLMIAYYSSLKGKDG